MDNIHDIQSPLMEGATIAIQALSKLNADHETMVDEYESKRNSLRTEVKAQLVFHDLLARLRVEEMKNFSDSYVANYGPLYSYKLPYGGNREILGNDNIFMIEDRLREISKTWGYEIDDEYHFRRIKS